MQFLQPSLKTSCLPCIFLQVCKILLCRGKYIGLVYYQIRYVVRLVAYFVTDIHHLFETLSQVQDYAILGAI